MVTTNDIALIAEKIMGWPLVSHSPNESEFSRLPNSPFIYLSPSPKLTRIAYCPSMRGYRGWIPDINSEDTLKLLESMRKRFRMRISTDGTYPYMIAIAYEPIELGVNYLFAGGGNTLGQAIVDVALCLIKNGMGK